MVDMRPEEPAPSSALSPLARARLDELLEELLQRVGSVLDSQERLRGLLDAVVAIASDLSLDRVLEKIAEAASRLVDAQYVALGVIASGHGPTAAAVHHLRAHPGAARRDRRSAHRPRDPRAHHRAPRAAAARRPARATRPRTASRRTIRR